MAAQKNVPEGPTTPPPSSPGRLADDGDSAWTTETGTAENDIEVLEGFDETITEE